MLQVLILNILFCFLKSINNFIHFLIKADGIALGAAAASSNTDVEMIVFIAIMLHKVKV